eukprot:725195-Amphidinium_carterae.1
MHFGSSRLGSCHHHGAKPYTVTIWRQLHIQQLTQEVGVEGGAVSWWCWRSQWRNHESKVKEEYVRTRLHPTYRLVGSSDIC